MIRQDHSRASVLGLALGDALGSQFFVPANRSAFDHRSLPPGPWAWTDDTEMACAIWHVLTQTGDLDQDLLAETGPQLARVSEAEVVVSCSAGFRLHPEARQALVGRTRFFRPSWRLP